MFDYQAAFNISLMVLGAVFALACWLFGRAQKRSDEEISAVKTEAARRIAEIEGHMTAERAKHDAQYETIHSRINDVKESFVRRDDFREGMAKVEKSMDSIAASQVSLQQTLTQVLVRLGAPPSV